MSTHDNPYESGTTQETLVGSNNSSPREKTSPLDEKAAHAHESSPPPLQRPEPARTASAWSRLTGRGSPRPTSPSSVSRGIPMSQVRSRDYPIYVGGDRPHVIQSVDSSLSHRPAAASLFGGVSPDDIDQEEGLVPVHSREEAEMREEERQKIAADPWSVKFEPGEKINPKVSSERERERDHVGWHRAASHTCTPHRHMPGPLDPDPVLPTERGLSAPFTDRLSHAAAVRRQPPAYETMRASSR